MDFNLNDEQELFVAGIRELPMLLREENWEAYLPSAIRQRLPLSVL